MKKLPLLLLAVSSLFIHWTANAQQALPTATHTVSNNYSSAPAFVGTWLSVDNNEFAIINEGFFTSIAKDSTGIWRNTHAGSYTVDAGNTVTLKVLYSSFPTHIRALHTVEYETSDDMLTIKWFKKLVDAKMGDITSQMPKGTQTKYMRVKK